MKTEVQKKPAELGKIITYFQADRLLKHFLKLARIDIQTRGDLSWIAGAGTRMTLPEASKIHFLLDYAHDVAKGGKVNILKKRLLKKVLGYCSFLIDEVFPTVKTTDFLAELGAKQDGLDHPTSLSYNFTFLKPEVLASLKEKTSNTQKILQEYFQPKKEQQK